MDKREERSEFDMKEFGLRLGTARRRKGLSQQSVCVVADLAPTHYSGIERGKKQGLRVTTLYKLCQVLDVSANYLLGFSETEHCPRRDDARHRYEV